MNKYFLIILFLVLPFTSMAKNQWTGISLIDQIDPGTFNSMSVLKDGTIYFSTQMDLFITTDDFKTVKKIPTTNSYISSSKFISKDIG